jgi:hypothetical protein
LRANRTFGLCLDSLVHALNPPRGLRHTDAYYHLRTCAVKHGPGVRLARGDEALTGTRSVRRKRGGSASSRSPPLISTCCRIRKMVGETRTSIRAFAASDLVHSLRGPEWGFAGYRRTRGSAVHKSLLCSSGSRATLGASCCGCLAPSFARRSCGTSAGRRYCFRRRA